MKRVISFLLVLLMVSLMFNVSFAKSNNNKFTNMNQHVKMENTMKIPLTTDASFFYKGGKVNIPVRGFASSMGVEVLWEPEYEFMEYDSVRAIVLTKGDIEVVILVDLNEIYKNEVLIDIGVHPEIYRNRSYVPNRFFKELFDAKFDKPMGRELIGEPGMDLMEDNLDDNYIVLKLVNETFEDNSFDMDNFELMNAPEGLTIESIMYNSTTMATLYLDFDGTDFDMNYNQFMIAISDEEFDSDKGDLTTQYMKIHAMLEPKLMYHIDEGLTEGNLDGAMIKLTMIDEMFEEDIVSEEAISVSSIMLYNAPEGLTIGSVEYLSPHAFNLMLDFDWMDFDMDITNFAIGVSGDILEGDDDIMTEYITISAMMESVMITSGAMLMEETLSGSSISAILMYDMFVDTTLAAINFNLHNAPTGMAIEMVDYISMTECAITFTFDGTDFESDIPDFMISIMGEELESGGTVTSNAIMIYAEDI